MALVGLVAAGSALATPTHAQVAAGVSVASDYRLRGISLSDGRPTLAVSAADDFANGVYLGGSVVGEDESGSRLRVLGHSEYLGYAARLASGATWELGLANQGYTGYRGSEFSLRYSEIYAGASARNLSARVYYSPNYNGSGHSAAYLETNATLRPADGWRVAGHVGVFSALNHWGRVYPRPRYDGRIDLIRTFGRAEVSLGWVGATPGLAPDPDRTRSAVIAGASIYF